jgi:hypothetical protein
VSPGTTPGDDFEDDEEVTAVESPEGLAGPKPKPRSGDKWAAPTTEQIEEARRRAEKL